MSDLMVQLTVRDRHRAITGKVSGRVAQAVWAALGAEPETIAELMVAMGRFVAPSPAGSILQNLEEGICLEPAESGLLLIDLAARLAIDRNRYFQAEMEGELNYHDGENSTGLHIYYELPRDWRVIQETTDWRNLAAELRLERAAVPRLDWRAVIYEHLPEQLIEVMNHPETLAADDRVRAAHARWMLTPRPELLGKNPRQVLLDQLEAIDADMESREWQWAMLGNCPPTLPTDSIAYRYGGCGPNERVLLYGLIRNLLCFLDHENARRQTTDRMVCAEELRTLRDEWLDQPDEEELHGLTPRQVIEQERVRQPWGVTGSQAIVDHDCPLCRMMAEDSHGPAFCHLDESNFDHDFAFSRHATREQWLRDEIRRAEFERSSQQRALAANDDPPQDPDSDSQSDLDGDENTDFDTDVGADVDPQVDPLLEPSLATDDDLAEEPQMMHVVVDLRTLQTRFSTIKGKSKGKAKAAPPSHPPQLSLAVKEEIKKRKRRLKAKAKKLAAARAGSPSSVDQNSSAPKNRSTPSDGSAHHNRSAPSDGSASKNEAAENIWLTSHCNLEAIREYPEGAVRNELLIFGMVAHLTELRSMSHAAGLPATLVRAPLIEFMDLRAAIKDQADWLYDTLIGRCLDSVEALSRANSKLEPQVRDLAEKFEQMRQLLLPQFTATGETST
jgi:hypothetical protein